MKKADGELVFQAIWCSKDTLSAANGRDMDRQFADARKRQKLSDHLLVKLQPSRRKTRESRRGRATLLGMKIRGRAEMCG